VPRGKKQVLCGVSFSLSPGLAGLLGRNGAGKTTLLETILSLIPADGGSVTLSREEGGQQVNPAALSGRARAALLAYAPQETGDVPHCTVLDYVVSGRTHMLGFFGNPGREDYAEAEKSAEFMGIGHLADRYLDEISGGERRLASLARAKAQGAVWMMLDEPAAGLDFGRQHEFFASLRQYVRETGTGALVSLHDPRLAASYCDTVLVLRDGRITAHLDTSSADFDVRYRKELSELYGENLINRKGIMG